MKVGLENVLRCLPRPAALLDPAGTVLLGNDAWRRACGEAATLPEAIPGVAFGEGEREAARNGTLRVTLVAGERRVRLASLPVDGEAHLLVSVETIDGDTSRAALAAEVARRDAMLQRARGLRHELNNCLMGVMGHADLLAAGDGDARVRERAEGILELVRRTEHLLREMGDSLDEE